ncbi:hypothetical protein ACLVWU_12625 [Bdellovibrio sp. HCB290]|uniref:hypothetical protein n=1 Tax=Bdellovibrio sp. HCB290 TaxID=3394356 RepID=UPI0039B55195
MKVSKKFLLTAVSIVSLHTASVALAEQSERHRGPSPEQREAFRECSESAGMERPEPGQRPTAPTEEQRTVMDACLKEKGFEPPSHFGRPGGGERPPREAAGVQ